TAQATGAAGEQLSGAIHLFQIAHYSEAQTQLVALMRISPTADVEYYLGRVYFAEDSVEGAVKAFESAAQLDPSSSVAHDWLARAYTIQLLSSNRFRQFILARRIRDELKRAVSLDGDNALARYDLARFYVRAPGMVGGDVSKARGEAEELTRRKSLYARFVSLDIAEHDRDTTRATAEINAALAEAPDSSTVYINAAAYYRRVARWDDAWHIVEAYAARHVDDAELDFEIGATAARSGQQLDRGIQALTAYLSRPWQAGMPTLGSSHLHRGLIYERRGDRDAARREFEAAVKLQPRNDDAHAGLDRVH
ncbi:MAG: tetratricopeptide repeat protein, partial [Gemmatimonadota bacterium]|nr:tetratricopeptide repeat protein [Gemmatimonadota bacterium]